MADGSPAELTPTLKDIALHAPKETERLFGMNYELKRINPGDVIPIGRSISDELTGVTADLEYFNPLVQQMHEQAGKYNPAELKKYLESTNIAIDENLFTKLYAFTQILEKKYPITPEAESLHSSVYTKEKWGKVKLSEVFDSGKAACSEIAILAQYHLQQEGIPSSFFNGEVLWNKNHEFADPHSFILIRNGDKQYIFDPANPIRTTQGKFPSIYTTQANFDQEVRKNQQRYVTSKNVVTKKEAYYGVGNATNVLPENIV